MIRTLKLTVAAAAALTVMSAPTMAADYFAGKQITVQVPSGSGGTYHVYCQLVQRNIARFIPGNPKNGFSENTKEYLSYFNVASRALVPFRAITAFDLFINI